jgi:hypothetical protein
LQYAGHVCRKGKRDVHVVIEVCGEAYCKWLIEVCGEAYCKWLIEVCGEACCKWLIKVCGEAYCKWLIKDLANKVNDNKWDKLEHFIGTRQLKIVFNDGLCFGDSVSPSYGFCQMQYRFARPIEEADVVSQQVLLHEILNFKRFHV